MSVIHPAVVVVLVLCVCSAAFADRLSIGDKAPPVEIEHWISEKAPITEFEPGKVYVIEFWATWCGPCVASIPHLRDLQEKHGDAITVISVSDEPLTAIEPFLERVHEGTTFGEITKAYWLATDPDGSVKESYMRAAGQNGIPCAFIVGKTGEIEWIGHPMRIDDPVAKVLAGTWDRAVYEREQAERTAFLHKLGQATQLTKKQDFSGAQAAVEAILASAPNDDLRKTAESALRYVKAQAAKWAAENGGAAGSAVDIRQLAIGDQVTIRVTGRIDGRVWGDAVYATASDVGAAAVHAGLIEPGESRWVKAWIVPSPSRFPEALAHGVQSQARPRATAAFFLQPAEPPPGGGGLIAPPNQGEAVLKPRKLPPWMEGHPEHRDASRHWYERELKEIGSNPGPVASTGKAVGEEDQLTADQVMLVQFGTSWWAARVIHLFPDGRVWIRYLGWSPAFDEAVKRNRLQFDDEAAAKARETVAGRRGKAGP
jgi:thiol-disulfide isomerase/thioredoxin